jgi:hypothetical protein
MGPNLGTSKCVVEPSGVEVGRHLQHVRVVRNPELATDELQDWRAVLIHDGTVLADKNEETIEPVVVHMVEHSGSAVVRVRPLSARPLHG